MLIAGTVTAAAVVVTDDNSQRVPVKPVGHEHEERMVQVPPFWHPKI